MIQQKQQGSETLLQVRRSDQNQPEYQEKFFWHPVYFSLWSEDSEDQWKQAKTSEVLHGTAKHPLTVYGVQLISFLNVSYLLMCLFSA